MIVIFNITLSSSPPGTLTFKTISDPSFFQCFLNFSPIVLDKGTLGNILVMMTMMMMMMTMSQNK